jgi:hypothetical protein
MSKHVAQSDRLTLSSHGNEIVFRIMLVSFILVTDTRRNKKVKVGKAVTRDTEFTGAVETLELRPAQQMQ